MQFDPAILKALQVSLSEDRKHIVIRSDRGAPMPMSFSFGIEEEYFLADAVRSKLRCEHPTNFSKR